MTLDVKFEEQDQTFSTNFGEIQTVSDGGFERGYNEGYAQGEVEGYDKGKTDGRVEGEQVGFDNAVSKLTTLEVTENGEYTPSDDNIGFDKVTVNIGGEEKTSFAKFAERSITEITANDLKGCSYIADYGFYNLCSNSKDDKIKKLTLPNSVKTLGIYGFAYADVEEIVLNEGITDIGQNCFVSCKSPIIEIPTTVTSIGDYAFRYYTGQVKWREGSQLTVIGKNVFSSSRMTSIELPNSIIEIGTDAFYMASLSNIKLSSNLQTIRYRAFFRCKFSNVELPNSLINIEGYTFSDCTSLSNIVIPKNVQKMDEYIFSGCTALTTVTMLPKTPPKTGWNIFHNCTALTKIIVPKGSLDAYKSATNWSAYADYMEEATE